MKKFRDLMQKPAPETRAHKHTDERSGFPPSHYIAKYILTCLES